MNERSMYPYWKKYLENKRPESTEVYELKFVNLAKGKAFAFNHVDEHQIEGLLDSLKGGYLRIMDQPWSSGGFQQTKLCDSLWIKASQAYIVIVFYLPRKYKHAYMIPIKEFIELRGGWKRKSIREEELTGFKKVVL